jgi:hypothetical protein
MLSGVIVGYDPGGNDAHGVAELRLEGGKVVVASTCTVETAEHVIALLEASSDLTALGVDTLTCWSTAGGGWRPADRWLRKRYKEVQASVVDGDGVFRRGGELVLGREAIVDGDHDQLAFMGELAAHHVMGVEIADDEAAAVQEHQTRREAVRLAHPLRRVDARRDRAMRRRDRQRRGGFQLRRFGIGDDAGGHVHFACLQMSHRLIGRAAGLLERLVDGGGIGIENNGHVNEDLRR